MDSVLQQMLRPAGGGLYTVSTGFAAQRELQKKIYRTQDESEIQEKWISALEGIAKAQLIILGVPSDVGAGFTRGANFGPQAIRQHLLERDSWIYRDERIIDIGDVLAVPQLLHDEMLSQQQLADSRLAMYGNAQSDLPASPLSMAQSVLEIVRKTAPNASLLLLGGDHSVGWPGLAAVAKGREEDVGILHFDAHTDLLKERLGVRYCFATWAYHANELIGRNKKLAQVGLRISAKTREHWETTCDLRQFWMDEVNEKSAEEIGKEIVGNFEQANVKGIYISNDIDGTDPEFAAATGTPEPGGLNPSMVTRLIEILGARFPVWGSDLVEVAPPLSGALKNEPQQTLETAALYIESQAKVSLALET